MRGCAEILGAVGALFGFLVVAEVVARGFVSWEEREGGRGRGGLELELRVECSAAGGAWALKLIS